MTTSINIDDLKYELRLLLGAAKISKVLEKASTGNAVNYAKDSVYLHARNLYNFFASDTSNDARVTQFTNHSFDLSLYNLWIGALHDHALHIKTKRSYNVSNVVNGIHLNDTTQDFADDIKRIWTEWRDITTDAAIKAQLTEALNTAEQESEDDAVLLAKKLS